MSDIVPVIASIGLITPLGDSAEQTWSALIEGQFIEDHARAGDAASSRVCALALRAAREAMRASPRPDALIIGTSKGSIENWIENRLAAPLAGRDGAYGLSDIATEIAREFDISGPRLTLSAACASGLHALIRGAMMIQSGQATRVLVVAAEASVHPLFIGSFKRLGVLAPQGHGCRPLDATRSGFLMSEAAAAVVLSAGGKQPATGSNEQPARRNARLHDSSALNTEHSALQREEGLSRIVVEAFALGGDATHLTGGDAEARTLRYLLRRVVDDRPVDLVHAHATGTEINDPTELSAIESAVDSSAHVYSHKGALGHSLGAAGLVSVVLNCMMHQRAVVLPNVRTTAPISSQLRISNRIVERPVSRSLVLASGFGGAAAVVSLRST